MAPSTCTSRPEAAPHRKWPRTRSRTCRPRPRLPCPPDALTPTPHSQARGDNRAGRDGQRHIVLLEVQHRPHLEADEPVVHPRVRRVVHGTPPPLPRRPPALGLRCPCPPSRDKIAIHQHRGVARRVHGLAVHDAHGGVRGYAGVPRPAASTAHLLSSSRGGRREPPARPPTRGRSLCRRTPSSSRPTLVRPGASLSAPRAASR